MLNMLMLVNIVKSIRNSQKKIDITLFEEISTFQYQQNLYINSKKTDKYHDFFNWQAEGIHPVYPYSLLTSIHFQIVNNKNFPFSPYGLIHKQETITCFKPLVHGLWEFNSQVVEFREIENGFEFDIKSELRINGDLYWRSLSTIFKRTQKKSSKNKIEKVEIENSLTWDLPSGHGLKYGLLSMNLDPIHISGVTAKIMGHKKAIMHGMWGVARGVTEIKELSCPFELETQFKSPIYLPSTVQFNRSKSCFSLHSCDGEKMHLISRYT